MRRYFADLLAVLSNRYQLCPTARHLAVYLLDLFMDHYDVAVRQLYVIALSCLLLASKLKMNLIAHHLIAISPQHPPTLILLLKYFCFFACFCTGKFEEKEDRVPKLEQLNTLGFMCSLNLTLNKRDLIKMELLLLETFGWNLCMPTPAHFIDYYLHAAVQEGDLHNGWPLSSMSKTKTFMDKYTHYFLEVSLQGEKNATFLFFYSKNKGIMINNDLIYFKWKSFITLMSLLPQTFEQLCDITKHMFVCVFVVDHAFLSFRPSQVDRGLRILQPPRPLSSCLPLQGPISMQVSMGPERHCLGLTYGSGYLSSHHTFTAGCFDR
uniref:Cyclin J-like n=1 Tax=Cyprinus carpio TaxID=7962 RepID=A0A8C1TRM4_CYPCA